MTRFNAFNLLKNALTGHKNWDEQWPDSQPKAEYDVVIVGAGGHGLGAAYYLDSQHGITNVAGAPEWDLTLSIMQDLKTTNSLTQYLITNQGTKKTIVYTPQTGGKGFTITALMLAAKVGGAGGSAAKSDITLPCDGQPVIA